MVLDSVLKKIFVKSSDLLWLNPKLLVEILNACYCLIDLFLLLGVTCRQKAPHVVYSLGVCDASNSICGGDL